MTFVQARNTIIAGLTAHIKRPVVLSDQIAERPDYPLCYYSVLAANIQDHSFGLRNVEQRGQGHVLQRFEQVESTLSFTCCSQNRRTKHCGYIFGEDEALALAEKCRGFFLLNGHNIPTEYGEIVIYNLSAIGNRKGFYKTDLSSDPRKGKYDDEPIHRFGFDVRFAYVRTDEMSIDIVEIANAVGETD